MKASFYEVEEKELVSKKKLDAPKKDLSVIIEDISYEVCNNESSANSVKVDAQRRDLLIPNEAIVSRELKVNAATTERVIGLSRTGMM